MKPLSAAVFSYIATFSSIHGNHSGRARALREAAMDHLMAAAFQAVEATINPSGAPVPDKYVNATLAAGMELAEDLMLTVQDGLLMKHSPALKGIHACDECLTADALAVAREYLYPEGLEEYLGSDTSTDMGTGFQPKPW